jgi:hypothetical protein
MMLLAHPGTPRAIVGTEPHPRTPLAIRQPHPVNALSPQANCKLQNLAVDRRSTRS